MDIIAILVLFTSIALSLYFLVETQKVATKCFNPALASRSSTLCLLVFPSVPPKLLFTGKGPSRVASPRID